MKEMSKFIITTRPEQKGNSVVSSRCFDIMNIPVTSLKVNTKLNFSEIREFDPDIAIFTSTFGSRIFLELDGSTLKDNVKIIAIGSKTAEVLSERYKDVIVPGEQTSTGVVSTLKEIMRVGEKIALFVSSKSNGLIDRYLKSIGAKHHTYELYLAEIVHKNNLTERILDRECFGIVVTSSYEARAIFSEILNANQRREAISGCHIFAIGKTTAETLLELDIPVSEPIGQSNIKKLIEEIDKSFC